MSKIIIPAKQSAPVDLGQIPLASDEMMFYMYLPIKTPKQSVIMGYLIPKRLEFLKPLLSEINRDLGNSLRDRYVYITCKNTYVAPNSMSQRMGWHIDGYQTEDLNYLWYSHAPTEFAIGDFELSVDDHTSLMDMEAQVPSAEIVTYPCETLLKLRAKEVHRVSENHDYEGMRLFVKISVSDHQFNLKGNSINHLMDERWEMKSRSKTRNMEKNNKDYA